MATVAILTVLLAWQLMPWIDRLFIRLTSEPRLITARGELAADESATIELFARSSPSVVFITTRQRVLNPWLIGINTAIYSPSGAYAGIGFAVPVDTVNRVVPQLIRLGKYIRPSLGISVDQDISRAAAQQLGVDGVLVLNIQPGSSAEAAGLRGSKLDRRGNIIPGDIIVAIDQTPVDSVPALLSRLDRYRAGDEIDIRIWRSGRELDLPIVLTAGR